MTCLCIGGVCIPYSAIIPALMVAFKWILDKLRSMGLLSSAAKSSSDGRCCSMPDSSAGSCCSTTGNKGEVKRKDRKSPEANFLPIESMEEWDQLVAQSKKTGAPIVVDFTASWCKPCKAIAPFFEGLSGKYDAIFIKVDVDELEELAEKAKVSMMPTFCVFAGEEQVDKMAGANEVKLEEMVSKNCSSLA